jgi:hypothetical protein
MPQAAFDQGIRPWFRIGIANPARKALHELGFTWSSPVKKDDDSFV